MRVFAQLTAGFAVAALLTGCGGDGGSGKVTTPTTGSNSGGGTTGGSGSGQSGSANCSLSARKDFVLSQMREWYLFPDTLPANPQPAQYSTVEDFLDSLTATARAQGKDRHFTYLTSIKDEDAYYNSGESAGYGFRISLDANADAIYVIETFENAPALKAGLMRGNVITAIGTNSSNLQTVASLYAQGGVDAVSDALGPSTNGTTRVFRVQSANGSDLVTVTKADYDIDPVSNRYGAKIITENGQKYGYVNLRTFISTADDQLRDAFRKFHDAGIDKVVVDLRYNGGGLLSTATVFDRLLGGNRTKSDVAYHLTFRPEKSDQNETDYFEPQPNSIPSMRIAFIGMQGTASASELLINSFIPYLHGADGLIGSNTYGKPVGQIALDNKDCDDRLRVIAFALTNANNQGSYFNGLANTVEASCQAPDDISYPLGDPREASTRAALDFLEGKSCTPITASGSRTTSSFERQRRTLLTPKRPNTQQREVPGLF